MRRSELRAERRRRRAELRERMREQRERLDEHPAVQQVREARAQRRRRRNRRLLMALSLLLLLLLLIRCEVPQIGGPGEPTPVAETRPEQADPTFGAHVETQNRPGYNVAARPGPDWLDELRLQVAARSTRLATCFNGSERGGAIRWTTSIDVKTGAVTGHELEPLGATPSLTDEQKRCATQALSQPGYHLTHPPSSKLPNRVSLVLEF